MSNPQSGQSFSVDDIRRIRDEDDRRRRDMTAKELAADVREAAAEGHRIMAAIKEQKAR
jgi:hypothetical protein